MSTEAGEPDWFRFLDSRLRVAVEAAVARGSDPEDALRGLYISDEQALTLSAEGDQPDAAAPFADAATRLRDASARLSLDALDAAVLALCSAPELHPRVGRLYAYLQDDVTRRLASPRLAAELLAGEGVDPHDVLERFGPSASLARRGAIHLLASDPTLPLADRPVKVADRLAAFILGAAELGDGFSGLRLRRLDPDPLIGRPQTVEHLSLLLAADTRLPLAVCGPDAGAVLADAFAGPLVILGVRELEQPDALADAQLAAALAGGLLCLGAIEDLTPAERARLVRAVDESPKRLVLIGSRPGDAVALTDRTAVTVDVPYPTFAERTHAWTELTGCDESRGVAAKFRLSIGQIHAAAEVSLIAAQTRGEATPKPSELDLGARQASSSLLGDLATHLAPGYSWFDLVLPERQLDLLRSISAYLLQRMEAYPGAVILATNFRRNIDDAFVRRLDFVIDFPFPEPDDRRRIWERVLPDAAPIAADVDLDFLANQFKLSGGAIRNCSLAAAFRAADEDSEIEMRHLVRAVAQEYGKQGRLTLEVDFERFHSGLRDEAR